MKNLKTPEIRLKWRFQYLIMKTISNEWMELTIAFVSIKNSTSILWILNRSCNEEYTKKWRSDVKKLSNKRSKSFCPPADRSDIFTNQLARDSREIQELQAKKNCNERFYSDSNSYFKLPKRVVDRSTVFPDRSVGSKKFLFYFVSLIWFPREVG